MLKFLMKPFRQKRFFYGIVKHLYFKSVVLSGFTNDAQFRISIEKAWTQLFFHLTLMNMHV